MASGDRIGIADRDVRKIRRVDEEHGEVQSGVGCGHGRLGALRRHAVRRERSLWKADVDSRNLGRDLDVLNPPRQQERLTAGDDVIVRDEVSERRDHESAAGRDFDAIHIDGSLDASFLDVGMQAADESNVHCGIGGRLCALRVGATRKKDHRRDERPGDVLAAAAMVHSRHRYVNDPGSTYNEMDEGES